MAVSPAALHDESHLSRHAASATRSRMPYTYLFIIPNFILYVNQNRGDLLATPVLSHNIARLFAVQLHQLLDRLFSDQAIGDVAVHLWIVELRRHLRVLAILLLHDIDLR